GASTRSSAEEVCEVRSDAASVEDPLGAIWPQCLLSGETEEDQDRHFRLPGFDAPVCYEPGWQIHDACEHDEETPAARASSHRRLVSRTSAHAIGIPA